METHFTSDLHIGHERINELAGRPFSSVEEMNEALIYNWNEAVSNEDEVYILGDIVMGKIADTLPMVQYLRGKKYLVPGNHDRCWRGNKKNLLDWKTKYEEAGLTVCDTFIHLVFEDFLFDVCHFPYTGDSHDNDRYVEYRPKDVGRYLLHGHVHEAWKINGRMINVGTDVWNFTPVNIKTILEEIR